MAGIITASAGRCNELPGKSAQNEMAMPNMTKGRKENLCYDCLPSPASLTRSHESTAYVPYSMRKRKKTLLQSPVIGIEHSTASV